MLKDVKMKEILTTFISAVDLINPILKNHHRRTAIIAYHIGMTYGLKPTALSNLVVAASLHDIGALTVEDSLALATLDVENPKPHAVLGAGMLSSYKAFQSISNIIRYHHVTMDEYNESRLTGNKIPTESCILHLSDRIEILLDNDELALNQVDQVMETISRLSDDLFCPDLVDVFKAVAKKEYFWFQIDDLSMQDVLGFVDIELICAENDMASLEELVYTLSRIIDYKCSFTASHSAGVAYVAYELAQYYGMSEEKSREIKVAGYLHDIGKIAVPSEIISKPGSLDTNEFNVIKSHPYYTRQILMHIKELEEIAEWAGAHHEKKDLSGYPRKPDEKELGVEVEIIAYADVFTALCEERPYREALSLNEVMCVLAKELVGKMGVRIFNLLSLHSKEIYEGLLLVQGASEQSYATSVIKE